MFRNQPTKATSHPYLERWYRIDESGGRSTVGLRCRGRGADGQIWAVVLALHGEQSPCARYALEFVFTAFDEVDA
jgi:hypothetical protein